MPYKKMWCILQSTRTKQTHWHCCLLVRDITALALLTDHMTTTHDLPSNHSSAADVFWDTQLTNIGQFWDWDWPVLHIHIFASSLLLADEPLRHILMTAVTILVPLLSLSLCCITGLTAWDILGTFVYVWVCVRNRKDLHSAKKVANMTTESWDTSCGR